MEQVNQSTDTDRREEHKAMQKEITEITENVVPSADTQQINHYKEQLGLTHMDVMFIFIGDAETSVGSIMELTERLEALDYTVTYFNRRYQSLAPDDGKKIVIKVQKSHDAYIRISDEPVSTQP